MLVLPFMGEKGDFGSSSDLSRNIMKPNILSNSRYNLDLSLKQCLPVLLLFITN